MLGRLLTLAGVVAAFGGCGDDGGVASDAAPADAAVDGREPVVPVRPALPSFLPCPDGWREVPPDGDDAPATCEPFDGAGHQDCGPTEAHFPGEPGCRAVTTACDAEGWPPGLPADGSVVYVRAGAISGDGLRGSPFATITEALAIIGSGDTVAVAPSTYREQLVVRTAARVVGCGEVTITWDGTPTVAVVVLVPAYFESIRVAATPHGMNVNADVELRGVVIEDTLIALAQLSSTVDAEELVIRRTANPLSISSSDSTSVRKLEVVDGTSTALDLIEGTASIDGAIVRRSAFGMDAALVNANPAAHVTVSRSAFVNVGTTRMFVIDRSDVEVTDTIVDGAPFAETRFDGGLVAFEGSTLAVTRVRISRGRFGGLGGSGAGTRVRATDLWLRDLDFGMEGDGGTAFEAGEGSEMDLERVLVERTRTIGLLATDAGTRVSMRDLAVRDTSADALGTFGRSLQVQKGALAIGERVELNRSHEAGVVASSPDTRLELTDATITRTAERACAPACPGAGIGLGVYVDATADLRGFVLADNALAGAQLARGGSLDLASGRVSGNTVGINVQDPEYDVSRLTPDVVFDDNGVNLDSTSLPIPDATLPRSVP